MGRPTIYLIVKCKVQQIQLYNSQGFYIESQGVAFGVSDGNRIVIHATGVDIGDTRLVKSNQQDSINE